MVSFPLSSLTPFFLLITLFMGMIGLQQIYLAYFRDKLLSLKTRATALANNCPPASSALRLCQSRDFQKGNRQHNTHSTTQWE